MNCCGLAVRFAWFCICACIACCIASEGFGGEGPGRMISFGDGDTSSLIRRLRRLWILWRAWYTAPLISIGASHLVPRQ